MKRIIIWSCILLLLLGGLGTAVFLLQKNSSAEAGYMLYYLSREEDRLITEGYEAEETEASALAAELYLVQQSLPEENKEEEELLLPENVKLLNYTVDLEHELICLDFSSEYTQMSAEREILVRAGMVRLFTQIEGIRKVQFLTEGEPLKNPEGQEIGTMTASRFVENSGKEINSYLKSTLTLYFTDGDGEHLAQEVRSVYYNSNVPLEKVVVEQLIKGAKESGHTASLPADLNILSVTIQEGICYVNLDNGFVNLLAAAGNTLNPELAVYSIVNSLADTCQVNKIQISVNGKTSVSIGAVDLSSLLSKREDLIKNEPPEEEAQAEKAAGETTAESKQ